MPPNPDVVQDYISPTGVAVPEAILDAVDVAGPSNTNGHSAPLEPREVLVTEPELRRMTIDAVYGKPKPQRDPARRKLQQQLLQEIEEIHERPLGSVDLPFDIPEGT